MKLRIAIWTGAAAVVLAAVGASAERNETAAGAPEVDADTIVACLLPARVRRLGGMVYPARRALTTTTARKCQLRGGEFTTYDRSTPQNSAAFFLPMANDGDAVAQTRLGEVYEYLFDPPRYEEARGWYEKAAAQGEAEGLRRLARLYENGLGVERDPLKATNLWRQATGSGDELVLASTLEEYRTEAEQRIAELTEQLRARNADAEVLRREFAEVQTEAARSRADYDASRRDLEEQRVALEAARAQSAGGADPQRVAALERELEQRERLIADQRYRIESLDAEVASKQAQLDGSMRQADLSSQRLLAELERVKVSSAAELAQAKTDLERKDEMLAAMATERAALEATVAAQVQDLERASSALTRARESSDSEAQARVADLEAQVRVARSTLETSQRKVEELSARLDAAQGEANALEGALASVTSDRDRLEAELATKEAQLVETETRLQATRRAHDAAAKELARVNAERDALARESVASAQVAAGERAARTTALKGEIAERDRQIALLEKRVADLDATRVNLERDLTKLAGDRNQVIAMRGVIDPLPDTSRIAVPKDIAVGRYFALVIGNNDYSALRPLEFAQDDARKVHETLVSNYGFRSELLLDATKRDIVARVESLADELNENDHLLIYYAGHGVQREASYWLGVDAPSMESGLDAYGVSSEELTRWVGQLPARHVLIVADSCYSGSGISSQGGMKFKPADVQRQLGFFLRNRARTILTSGGNEPVPDNDAVGGSVFTRTFVDLLKENKGFLADVDLYAHLKERVRYTVGVNGVPTPEFAHVDGCHGAGQFVFIRPKVLDART